MSVRQVWKRKTSTPKSSPPSQNDSPPLPLRVYLQSPSPPSYNPLRDQMINQLHNISTILDSHNNPSNAYIHAPPSPPPPQIHPPSHAQVEFHLSFCHCCKFSRHQFYSLRNEINFIHYLLTRPIPPTHEEEVIKVTKKKNLENDIVDETLEIDEIVNIKESWNHPLENVTGNLNQRTLRSQAQNQSNFFCFISTIEPKNLNEALGDESWIVPMQEELNQFVANDVWELVPQPRNMTIIGTKWVFRNKLDENGIVSRNKVRLVAQGYNQQEGIDYDKTYAPVAGLESIRILLAYACTLDFKLF
ncbi:retrovirus-related pol polyprotein from transposon TNT 1-94 [Tanacetum coccineum]